MAILQKKFTHNGQQRQTYGLKTVDFPKINDWLSTSCRMMIFKEFDGISQNHIREIDNMIFIEFELWNLWDFLYFAERKLWRETERAIDVFPTTLRTIHKQHKISTCFQCIFTHALSFISWNCFINSVAEWGFNPICEPLINKQGSQKGQLGLSHSRLPKLIAPVKK